MTYSIIGSGAIGSALAGHFASKGIEVSLANNRGPASLKEIVRKLGSKVKAVTVKEAASADIVILAVPFPAVPDAVSAISDWRGRIVVDATNAVDLPSFTPTDLGGRPSSEIVAQAVPGARVVKAFNTLMAAVLPRQEAGASFSCRPKTPMRPLRSAPCASDWVFIQSISAGYRKAAVSNSLVDLCLRRIW